MKKKIQIDKKQVKYFAFLHFIIFLLSLGGVASKIASGKEFMSFDFIFFYGLVILDLGIYAILWQQMLKHIPLTTAFCNKAVGIIWGMLWGALIFQETITVTMIIGAVIVLIGVCLVVTSDE